MPSKRSHLQRLAQLCGVQLSYLDNAGREQTASDETLHRLLSIFGVSSENGEAIQNSLEQRRSGFAARTSEPVHVCWAGTGRIKLNLAGSATCGLSLELEDGSRRKLDLASWTEGLTRPNDSDQIGVQISALPPGYHRLVVETARARHESLLISAPRQIYDQRDCVKEWGIFIPLYALRSKESWGAGSFTDWKELVRWVASRGGRVLASLPILASFLGEPVCDPSPYSPASRLFWSEFYIDVAAIPEFQRSTRARRLVSSATFEARLARFRKSEFIDYREQMVLKREVLELLAREFFVREGPRRSEFEQFRTSRPELEDYASFRAAGEKACRSWQAWSDPARSGTLGPPDYAEAARRYHLYVQWIAQQQIDDVLAAGRAVDAKFYLDLPLGVHAGSYDAWRFREFFAQGVSAGAPPDSFFTKGQDWGFAPLHPQRMRDLHYKYVIDYLRFQMKHTAMLRLDHIMALHRLYWIPRGLPARAGAYVQYPAEELYAILSVESHRHNCVLVGENLGTVPPEVNRSMDRHGVRKMYVFQYEQPSRGRLASPGGKFVASLNTHDMPAFAAHWKAKDIGDRVALGLLDRKTARLEKVRRHKLKNLVIQNLRKAKLICSRKPGTRQVFEAAAEFLARSDAETVLVNLEDLWLEERPQNVPGTSDERPNWRRKAAKTLEQLKSDRSIGEFFGRINGARAHHRHPQS